MPPRPRTFSRPANVKLDSNGYGFVAVTAPGNVVWHVKRVSCSTNAAIPVPGSGVVSVQPTVTVYKDNKPNAAAFMAGSYSGNRTSARAEETLLPGESLCAEWVGSTAHAGLIATVVVSGEYEEGF